MSELIYTYSHTEIQMEQSHAQRLNGIWLMLLSMFCFAVMGVFIRDLSATVASPVIVFLRNLMSLGIMLPVMLAGGAQLTRSAYIGSHFWRSLLGAISMQAWFYAISTMPITTATALSFTTPLFVTLFAILMLGERAGMRRWAALLAGFAGTLIITRPWSTGIDLNAGFVLFSSAVMGVVSILIKNLTRTEPATRIVFYMALFMTLFSLPVAVPFFAPLSPVEYAKAFAVALSSTIAHLLLARAYTKAEMVVLMPFDYSRLIFTAVLAYFVFAEQLDSWTVIGSLVIVASSVYITHREALLKKLP